MKTIIICAGLAVLALASAARATSVPWEDPFALIEGGTSLMGSPASENWRRDDETQHQVTVATFRMARHEVTQAEWHEVMGSVPSSSKGDRLPVESVTWLEAVRFCNAKSEREGLSPAYAIDGEAVEWDLASDGYRLPTEAEWERACRAGTTGPFNVDRSIGADEANYYGHYPYEIEENYFDQSKLATRPGIYRGKPVEVGSFEPNAFGLFDMHGNVGEWCWDVYGPYPTEPQVDPTGPVEGTRRVARGGGWNDFAKDLRSAYRSAMPQDTRSASIGLRLARGAIGTGTIRSVARQSAVGGKKILIAYFTWSGNTRGIAHEIQRQAGGDLFEIEPATPYSTSYDTVLREAQRDQRVQARPELKAWPEDMGRYDIVILGYPNWWASIPMPVATFLEQQDMTGKRILPFCSHGGGRFGQSLAVIAKLAPGATVTKGLSVHYSGGAGLEGDVAAWLEEVRARP